MRGLFVTGTGTDIGKTYVSAAIARELTSKNLNLAYYKAAAYSFINKVLYKADVFI